MKRHLPCAIFLCLACQPLEDGHLEGQHVIVSADPGLQLCGGSLAFMDEFVERASQEFSLSAPIGEDRIDFHWLDPQNFVDRSQCSAKVLGCARGHESFSRSAPHNHEIVHNLASSVGHPPAFFVEGLAVAYEGLGAQLQTGASPSGVDIREALTASGEVLGDEGLYPLAGEFTVFLISRHGIEAYLRLYATLDANADDEEFDRVFREYFGAPLDESIADFEARPSSCAHDAYDAKLMECSAPALEWDGRALQMSRTLSCEDTDVVGPFSQGSAVSFHTIDIFERGLYELRVVGDEEDSRIETKHSVSLHSCEDACRPRYFMAGARQAPRIGWLDAGRYSLRLHGPADAATIIGFQFLRIDVPSSATEPNMIGAETRRLAPFMQ